MRKILLALLAVLIVAGAHAQRSVTATIQNFNRSGSDFTFDIYAQSTGSPQVNLGWSNFFFYFNTGALSSPTLSNINSKFTGDSLSTDYAPMRVVIVNSTPPRLGVQIFYTGHGAQTGQQLSTAAPFGERICTVRLTLTNGAANSDISWDAGGSYANTWILSKDTVQVSNTINGVGSSTNDVPIGTGWNMLSVPVVAADMRSSVLYPGASTPAYGYNNGYFTADTLFTGKGYWMKFGAADTFTVFGTKVTPQTIAVVSGWNMIGPLDFNARITAITSTPPGIVSTPYYGYNNGYTVADTLKRGKGYWVKATQAGTLNLGAAAAAKIGEDGSFVLDNWITIEIEDNNSVKSILYLAKPDEMHGSFELPPPAPSGIVDVRFSGNTIAEPLGQVHQVLLNSVAYPVKMRLKNSAGMALQIRDVVNGSLLNAVLKEGTDLTIAQRLERIEIIEVQASSKQIPTVYELNQNYPNPFNPTTIIKFALPKDSHVAMSVYNILGQKVADLVNDQYVAGYHQVEFNASDVASGMYLYKLEAGGFVQTKKMLILK